MKLGRNINMAKKTSAVSPYSIDEMADRLAIYDLYERYVHAVDDHQLEVLDTIFLPDTFFDMTSVEHGTFTWEGGMRDDYQNNWKNFSHLFHDCGSVRIDFENAKRTSARVKSKMITPIGMRNADGGIDVVLVFGAYSDMLVKAEAGWRVKSRKWDVSLTVGKFGNIEGSAGTLEKR
jgi:hypothetical protein